MFAILFKRILNTFQFARTWSEHPCLLPIFDYFIIHSRIFNQKLNIEYINGMFNKNVNLSTDENS